MKTKSSSASVRAVQTKRKKISAELAALQRQAVIAKKEAHTTKTALKAAKDRHREAKHVAKKLKKTVRALQEELKVLTARSIRPALKAKTGSTRVKKAGAVRLRPLASPTAEGEATSLRAASAMENPETPRVPLKPAPPTS